MNASRLITIRLLLLFSLTACQPVPTSIPPTSTPLWFPTSPPPTETVTPAPTVTPQTKPIATSTTLSTPHPILGDVRVRQAIAHCTNRLELIAAAYPWVPDPTLLEMDSFVPRTHWAYADSEPGFTRYPFDPERGEALLEETGWTLPEGSTYRTNGNGDELVLGLSTTTAALRQAWASVFEEQMKVCGMRLLRNHLPASEFFAEDGDLQRRRFDLAAYAWAYMSDPNGRALYLCDQIPTSENNWKGQNFMAWCNEQADAAIRIATSLLSREERRKAYRDFQEAFAHDLPSLPLFVRANINAANPALENFAPGPTGVYTWNAAQWHLPDQDTIVLGETSEPASLFALETSYVSQVIRGLVLGLDYNNLDYDYQPLMLKQFPSIENGAVTVQTVEVREGEVVVGADGKVTELKPAVRLRDGNGNEFDYSGGTAQLTQWIVHYEFVDGLTWSDGTPVIKGDYELAYHATCDPETGAAEFLDQLPACEKIAQADFVSDTTYVVTWLPGYQDPLYFLPPIGRQPAHQMLGDGRRLVDVPPSQWLSLPEVSERPLGTGPYVVTDWTHGQQIVLSANPHYYTGPPATPTIIIRFVEPTQTLMSLRSGAIDVLGWDSILPEQAADLLMAQVAGDVRVIITPSNSYEHIDFSLFTP